MPREVRPPTPSYLLLQPAGQDGACTTTWTSWIAMSCTSSETLSYKYGGQRNPRSLLATFVRRWQTSQTQVVVQEIYIIEFLLYGSTFKRTEVEKGDRNSRSGNEAQEPLAELRKIYFPISYFIALNSLSKILTTVRRDKQWGVVYQKRDTLEALHYGYSWFLRTSFFSLGVTKIFLKGFIRFCNGLTNFYFQGFS